MRPSLRALQDAAIATVHSHSQAFENALGADFAAAPLRTSASPDGARRLGTAGYRRASLVRRGGLRPHELPKSNPRAATRSTRGGG
ncbi:hypothetical protein PG991_009157 [Apiospora marii]|uniref:Uncharacterized protein n=1 Tax=Apiospora marii TaxID=335849 RepID=A0ABR1RM00_9PEZI